MQLPSTRVLVVHRNLEFAPRLKQHLGSLANVDVTFATDWHEPAGAADGHDVVLIDLTAHIPEGFDLYRLIQPHAAAMPPVLMLRATGAAAVEGRRPGEGLSAVESRLQTALGRFPHLPGARTFRFAGAHLRAELPNNHVLVDGRRVALSQREGELLRALLVNCNRVVSRAALFAEIWGYETRALDVYVRRLRRKLGAAGAQLETVVALGYRFADTNALARTPHRKDASR